MPAAFLSLDEVATELAVSRSQAYALVRNGELPAMQVGGRGQWRIGRVRLEEWIAEKHRATAKFAQERPRTMRRRGLPPPAQ